MAVLVSFLDFLSPALTAGTTAAGAYQQGKAQGGQQNMQNSLTLAQLVRQKGLDEQSALNSDADRRLKGQEGAYYTAGVDQRKADVADKAVKALTNQKAYNTLKATFPKHVMAGGEFDPGSDYVSPLAEAQKLDLDTQKSQRTQKGAAATLALEFPRHALAKRPFSPDDPADYVKALEDARDQRKLAATQSKQHWVQTGRVDPATGFGINMNTETGEEVVAKGPPSARGGAGGSQAPVADMEQRYSEIAQHAKDLAAKKWQISSGMQAREGMNYGTALDNAAGKPAIGKMLGSSGIEMLGLSGSPEDFARYQTLMNSTRAIGDDVAKVFKGRQNEQAVLREVALAELTADDYNNPKQVEQKLDRLRHVIALAKQTMPGGMITEPPQTGGAVHTPKGDPLLSKYNITPSTP